MNGKRYVGQSIDIKRRFNQHKRKPPDGMREDFELYGVDKFKFEVLEECAPENLTAREDFYLDTLKPEYNIRTEGHGISDAAREKLRRDRTGKKRPDISRRVKCVETGEVFESLRAAAKWCNVPAPNLSALLSGKIPTRDVSSARSDIRAWQSSPKKSRLNSATSLFMPTGLLRNLTATL